ncbi:MAG: S8 family serine peptidase [Actinomycetota bacterium]|nr:S8 family serine peptidase [Actinomycetota bacterium]
MPKLRFIGALVAAALALGAMPLSSATGGTGDMKTYLVVFKGDYALDGTYALGGNYALNHEYALSLVKTAGGTVTSDLSKQIGVMIVQSPNALFDETMRTYALVEEASEDWSWQGIPSGDAIAGSTFSHPGDGGGGPEPSADPLESQQWDMRNIQAPEAHQKQAGWRAVDVGILDSGIDGRHIDFTDNGVPGGPTNVDCARGRNSLAALPPGVAVGTPDPCSDNQFHGTHVAGTVGAQANGVGIVGVAPNVTLVPVKVCDSTGYCYVSAVVDGITYAGDQKFDVINMSFFVDDNAFQESHEFKCMDDPVQRTFRKAVERAIQYARNQGVTPVAALGNSDNDLAHPPEPYENDCDVVPAETQGVVGTMALGARNEKAGYSNYGFGMTDVAAPGGNGTTGICTTTVLSTIPGDLYVCIQGTSMASPHTAGVAALIESQYGRLGEDGDVKLPPQTVEDYLQATTIDQGLPGYDECFGNGRINALRAVNHDTSRVYDPTAPYCAEYQE